MELSVLIIKIVLWLSTIIFSLSAAILFYLLIPFKSIWLKGLIGLTIGGVALIAALATQGYLACTYPFLVMGLIGKLTKANRNEQQPLIKKDPEPAHKLEVKPKTKAKFARFTIVGEEKILVEYGAYKVDKGSTTTIKHSRTIEKAIEVEMGVGVNAEVGADISIIKAAVKGYIEGKTKKRYSERQDIEVQVELKGDEPGTYQVSWYQLWLIGNAEAYPSDTIISIPVRYYDHMVYEVKKLS